MAVIWKKLVYASGGAANTLAYWSDASSIGDLSNSIGYLYNDGAGNFTYTTSIPDEHVVHDKVGSPTLFTLHDDWITRGSAGVIDGTLTYVTPDAGAGTHHVQVAAGDGYLRSTNDQQGELKFVHWSAATAIEIPTPAAGQETVRFIGVEYNSGTPQVTTRTTFNWNWFNDFPLGRVSYDGTTLRILNAYAHSEDTANFTRKYLRLIMPFQREEAPEGTGGLEISDVATRQLAMTAGNVWHGFNRYALSAVTAGTAFDTHYRRAGGGFNSTAGVTQWPNTQYDDGSGTLVTMTNNKYACLWVFVDVSDGSLDVMYGRDQYNTATLAQAEAIPNTPGHLTYHGRLIGRLIFQKSASSATFVESAWSSTFRGGSVTVPGGSDGQIQYNNSGTFNGDADLTWDDTGKALTVGGAGYASLYGLIQGVANGTPDGLAIYGGTGTAGNTGGDVRIFGGTGGATNENGGSIVLTPGTGTGSGGDGYIAFRDLSSAFHIVFEFETLTTNRLIRFPNAAGTLALVGGADTQVLFNDGGGTIAGDVGFYWNKTTHILTVSRGSGGAGTAQIQGKRDANNNGLSIGAGIAAGGSGLAGGTMTVYGGAGDGAGLGGWVYVSAGAGGATGQGGGIEVDAGEGGATSGNGGDVLFTGGAARGGNSNGGSITFYPGIGSGSGVKGSLLLHDPVNGFDAGFETSSLSADRTFTFPNQTGTFAMTHIADTTDSSSVSTGALIIDGGVGIAKKLYVGSDTIITGGMTVSGASLAFNNASPIFIIGVGSAGVSSAFRILPNISGKNYIQAGESNADTAANITFSRYGSTSNLATLDMLTDAAYVYGTLGVGNTAISTHGIRVTNATTAASFYVTDSGTTNVTTNVMIVHNTSGTAANGMGLQVGYYIQSSTTATTIAALDQTYWVDATHASRKARRLFFVYDTVGREAMRIEASGSAPMIGFFGGGAVVKPTAYTQTYSTADKTHANSTYSAPSGGATVDANCRTSLGQLAADVVDVKQLCNAIIDDLQALGLFG